MELPVVNHEDNFAKIGDDHKFQINKFGELANYLPQNKIVSKFHKPSACSFETLSYAHSKNYILDIKNKTLSKEGVKKIGFPLVDSVVQRSLVATGGTVLASKLAINYVSHVILQVGVTMQVMMEVQVIVYLMMLQLLRIIYLIEV